MLSLFEHTFMQKALIGALLLSLLLPAIGTFVVARKSSLIADTLAHVSLLGIACTFLIGISPIVGTITAAILGALSFEILQGKKRIGTDALQALFLSGSLALALIISAFSPKGISQLESYLFGSLLTLKNVDLLWIGGVTLLTLFLLTRFWWGFLNISFDEDLAITTGYKVKSLRILMGLLIGLAIALAVPLVGSLLVGALMVIPVLSAIQIGQSFRGTFIISIGISLLSSVGGLIFSYYFDLPTSASIIVVNMLFFLFLAALRSLKTV